MNVKSYMENIQSEIEEEESQQVASKRAKPPGSK